MLEDEFDAERFRRILQNITDIITVIDRDGNIRYVSPSMERLSGYRSEQLVGKDVTGHVHPQDLAGVREMIQRAFQRIGEPTVAVFRFQHKDGSWRNLEATCKVRGEGLNVEGIITARDITFQTRIEQRLKENEERLQLITDNILDLVTLVDPSRVRRYVSPSYPRVLGYASQDLLGKPLTSLVHPDDVGKASGAIEAALQTRSVHEAECRVRHADGHHLWIETVGKWLFDEAGNPTGGILSSRDITERMLAQERIERQLRQLQALHIVDRTISSSFDLRATLDVLLQQVQEQLQVDAADILLFDRHMQSLDFAVGRGFKTRLLEDTHLRLGDVYAGLGALERRLISVPDAMATPTNLTRLLQEAGEQFVTYYAVPLVAKGELKGVLQVFHRSRLDVDQEWIDFLETLGNQAAIAIEDLSLLEALQRSNLELELAYDSTLEGWSRALDLRDKETEGHTQRVVDMTIRLGREHGLSDDELIHLRRGALLHDIGKMGVPDSILHKGAALNDQEWEIMRKHPIYAYELLSPIGFLRPALDIPYCHHEKWDGTGYPRALKGREIPLAARLFAVVDVWDALSSDRPYRPGWLKDRVLEHIQAEAGKHFDPDVVSTFMRMVAER
jgi:PAS domain S-box-containing protein